VSKDKVSIIIPTVNEEKGIRLVLQKIPPHLNCEIIVVNGCSTDRTVKIAKNLGAKVITEKRKGYGRAYKTGLKYAKGNIIATLDGDGSYNPKDIEALVKVLKDRGVDFVSGNRLRNLEKGSMNSLQKFGNWLISMISNILFNTKIYDSQSGMWVFYKNLLKKIKLKEDGMSFSSEIKLEAYKKAKFLEYPISYKKRIGKKKEKMLKQGYEILKFLLKKRLGP
jgi:glycosyltransferase involved in cell wall biosynthesis